MKRSPYTVNAGRTTVRGVPTDRHGNAMGSDWDLAQDGGFLGHKIVVLHLYTGEGFDFEEPTQALKKKGFKVNRFPNNHPPIQELRAELADASECWVISDAAKKLGPEHIETIVEFYEAGHGLYIWGDNSPYHADANALLNRLYQSSMEGNFMGNKTVNESSTATSPGFIQHLITTGLNHLYEGITISSIQLTSGLKPLVRSTDGNCVTAFFDSDGRRALVDGGFTRLYTQWDDAGTARFVTNAAAWLVNWERFAPPEQSINEKDRQTLRDLL
jgi:hypothetical protein